MGIQYAGGTNRNDLYAGVTTSDQALADINTTLVAAGWSSSAVKASVTLTATGNCANNDTITVAGKVYTFKTVINNANNGEISVGVDAATSLSNLKAAINLGAGSGTAYSSATTLNATLEGGTLTTTTLVIQEKTGGVTNAVAVSETLSNMTLSSANTIDGGYQWTSVTTPQFLGCVFWAANHSEGNTWLRIVAANPSLTEQSAAIGSGQRLFGGASIDIRIIADRYQAFIMIDGVSGSVTNSFCGLGSPWLPNFLTGSQITAATNASPIVVTTAAAHGYTTGNSVTIRGALGNTAANVTNNTITVTGATTFSIDGSVGNGTWTSGGAVGKVGQQVVEAIWFLGTGNSEQMVRFGLTADTNTFWTALNGSTNAHSGGGGTGTLKFAVPVSSGYPSDALQWFNTSYLATEPFLVFGTATGATGFLIGQMWDAVIIRSAMTKDDPGTFDSHNWWNLTDNNTTTNGSVVHVVP